MKSKIAAITLGSNSFNMLVAKVEDKQPVIVAKYKRKVRLANGLTDSGSLNQEAMARGLECLSWFAEKLTEHQIAAEYTQVIATATLRKATNAETFNGQALSILSQPIQVISGEQEAELIYQGMFHTTHGEHRRLVIDIGGASTEFIVGDGEQLLFKTSLPIGCVSYQQPHFSNFPYQAKQFDSVFQQIEITLAPHIEQLKSYACHNAVGASGSVQTMMEILRARGQDEVITLEWLQRVKREVLQQTCPSLSQISGLSAERAPTLATGVAILLALFELLELKSINLSGGALREGVLYRLMNATFTSED